MLDLGAPTRCFSVTLNPSVMKTASRFLSLASVCLFAASASAQLAEEFHTWTNTSGKTVEAMALSVSPTRYVDPAKVEKWFKRNCNEVLGRECNAREKGDWLTFMLGQ